MFKIKSLSDCKVSVLMADVGNAGALFCLVCGSADGKSCIEIIFCKQNLHFI